MADDEAVPDTAATVAERLSAWREEQAQAQAQAAEAQQSQDAADQELAAAYAYCGVRCRPVLDAIAAAQEKGDADEERVLWELAAETHEPHREMVEEAHLADSGQTRGESHPIKPGESGTLASHVTVASDATV